MKSELSRNLVIGKLVSHICYLGRLRSSENNGLDMLEVFSHPDSCIPVYDFVRYWCPELKVEEHI
jgi:hypothetical protein